MSHRALLENVHIGDMGFLLKYYYCIFYLFKIHICTYGHILSSLSAEVFL